LVNKKTQRPVEFAYEAFSFEANPLASCASSAGTAAVSDSTIWKLNKDVVYVRRGSSTDEADLMKCRMGAADRAGGVEAEQPALDVQFCDPDQHTELGTRVVIRYGLSPVPGDSDIPDHGPGGGLAAALSAHLANQNFYRDVAKFTWASGMFRPLAFVVENRAP